MKFSYNWLKELVPTLPPPKETATLLTLHAFEVADLYREQGDWVLDIDVLPNRISDASSHLGMARELSAILSVQRGGKSFDTTLGRQPVMVKLPAVRLREGLPGVGSFLHVRVEDSQGCPFYAARVLNDVRVGFSPAWLRKRLAVLGLQSVNNVVDATNLVMLETGQPLHAFDAERIEGRGKRRMLVVRKAKRGEKIVTLDGAHKYLDASMTVIADSTRPLAIAGVKGGDAAAITMKTKALVIESAIFAPNRIYRTSRAVGIVTDASKRFEVPRSPESAIAALDRVASLIAELTGGKLVQGSVTVGKRKTAARAVPFSSKAVTRLLGMTISDAEAKRTLVSLGCRVYPTARKGVGLAVTPPCDRFDLEREEDLAEEVGRLSGYHLIAKDLPRAILALPSVPAEYRWADVVREVLASRGCNETMRLSLLDMRLLTQWGFRSEQVVALENPQSQEAAFLRPTMLPRMLVQAEEARRSEKQVRLFEVGKTFHSGKNGGVHELPMISIVFACDANPETQAGKKIGEGVFYELKGAVMDLCERFGIPHASIQAHRGKPKASYLHSGKAATLDIDGMHAGVLGELSPRLLAAHPALGVCALAALRLDVLAAAATQEYEYKEPSRFPEVLRDVAVLVPAAVPADDVEQEIHRIGKAIVRDTDLFDYYEGEGIPEGWKSLAFRIFYQSLTQTLTGTEVDVVHEQIVRALEARGWEVR